MIIFWISPGAAVSIGLGSAAVAVLFVLAVV
jgi:hypothetical protein